MVALKFDGGGGGASTTGAGILTASDGGPHVLSFAIRPGDFCRGFRCYFMAEDGSAEGHGRVFASLGDFPARVNDDVFRNGASLITDLLDASGGTDWINSGKFGGLYIHVNHFAKALRYLNIALRSDDAVALPSFIVSADILPAEYLSFLAGRGLCDDVL